METPAPGTVLVAVLADGINPCAFTVLLLFVAALLGIAQARPDGGASLRGRIVGLVPNS
jgi:hypothetical protein